MVFLSFILLSKFTLSFSLLLVFFLLLSKTNYFPWVFFPLIWVFFFPPSSFRTKYFLNSFSLLLVFFFFFFFFFPLSLLFR